MNLNMFGCKKYKKLSFDQRDRELTPGEIAFMGAHEERCEECARSMESASFALDALRGEFMEPVPCPNFESKVIRQYRIESKRASLRYWSPAVVGAAVAGLVVLAAMQMIAQSSQLPSFKVPTGEARLSKPAIPNLDSLDFHKSWQ
ncbi:MAG TPA: hypothetical protein VGL56_17210 [Fimbriimonadaceae bacterium]|jgi:hypothetical protein